MATAFSNLIDGQPVDSADRTTDINPSNLADVVGEFARASTADARRRRSPSARHGVPEVVADDAAGAVRHPRPRRHRDPGAQGRARPAALARAGQAARRRHRRSRARRARSSSSSPAKRCAWPARRSTPSRPGIDVEVTREPLGVVAAITPWNFPLAIPAWKIAPALAFGNCVVFKPAELVPASPWTLADIVQRAGLPPGVLNLVMGPGSKLGAALASSPDVDAVSFTGSQDVGPSVAAAAVADRRARAARDGRQEPAHRARRRGSGDGGVGRGQRRVLPGRAALHGVEPAHRHRGHSRSLRRGDGRAHEEARHRRRAEAGTEIGPVVDERQLEKNLEYVEIGQQRRARGSRTAASG